MMMPVEMMGGGAAGGGATGGGATGGGAQDPMDAMEPPFRRKRRSAEPSTMIQVNKNVKLRYTSLKVIRLMVTDERIIAKSSTFDRCRSNSRPR